LGEPLYTDGDTQDQVDRCSSLNGVSSVNTADRLRISALVSAYQSEILQGATQLVATVYSWRQQLTDPLDDSFSALQQVLKKVLRETSVAL